MDKQKMKKPILLKEDTAAIDKFQSELQFKVNHTGDLLNAIAKNMKFNNVDELPSDVVAYIWQQYLSRNPDAAKQAAFDNKFTIENVTLPADLASLREALTQWHRWENKKMIDYLIRTGNEYEVNRQKIENDVLKFTETQRQYLTDEAQEMRYHDCNNVKQAVYNIGVDFSTDAVSVAMLRNQLIRGCQFIVWHGFPANRFEINNNYVITGRF